MGTYTYQNFTDYLAFNVELRTDLSTSSLPTGGSTDMYGVWVNAAYIDLTSRDKFWGIKKHFVFPELETVATGTSTVDGTATIAVPSDCLVTRHLHNYTSDARLKKITWREYLQKIDRADTNAEGKPTQWVRAASTYYLSPTPDAAYNIYIYYRKRPAVLTGTNKTVIGAEWDEPILYLATYKALMATHQYDKADMFKKEFLEMVSGIIGIYDQEDFARDTRLSPDLTLIKGR